MLHIWLNTLTYEHGGALFWWWALGPGPLPPKSGAEKTTWGRRWWWGKSADNCGRQAHNWYPSRRYTEHALVRTKCRNKDKASQKLQVSDQQKESLNIEWRQHVFVCEDLNPLLYTLLKYMKKSFSDIRTCCFTRIGKILQKLRSRPLANC